MKRLTAFFKQLRLRQIVTVFLAGVLLIVSVACSGANAQGANPNNPAVQAGGGNNPYKAGGDNYTNLKMSTDSKVDTTNAKSKGNQANLPLNSQQLIAASREPEILYPGAETPEGRAEKEAELPIKTNEDFQQPKSGGLNQRNPNLGERLEDRVEKAKEAFEEASQFGKASQRPEYQGDSAPRK